MTHTVHQDLLQPATSVIIRATFVFLSVECCDDQHLMELAFMNDYTALGQAFIHSFQKMGL